MRGIIPAILLAMAMIPAAGCKLPPAQQAEAQPFPLPPIDMPRELSKIVLPTYTIEPPDILVIEALHIVPLSTPDRPYLLRTGDIVSVVGQTDAPTAAPISGYYPIQPGGIINLGPVYGSVKISGLSIDDAYAALREFLSPPRIQNVSIQSISLAEMAGKQQIAGQHLVGPDGTVTLGSYGSVPVVGQTLAQAKATIQSHLRQFLEDPDVSVDVFAYNSKVYYIITEGAGLGDGVNRFPVTGNETVLDAIANINGLTQVSSKKIWIARPLPHCNDMQILPVDWQAITAHGAAITNYQIMPGDRVFVAEDRLVAFDTNLAKLLAPLERGMGFILLGTGTVSRLSGNVLQGGGIGQGGFGGGGFL